MKITSETVILITGASSGIGEALAKQAAAAGAKVAITARREERLNNLVSEIEQAGGTALAIAADISVKSEAEGVVAETMKAFGRVDVLVNNAGRGNRAIVEDTTEEMLQSVFAVNTFSLWYMTAAVLPQMKERNSGHIINVASIVGKLAYPCNSAYVAAKHACVGFTAGLRAELSGTGVEATVICPAGVATEWAGATEGGPIGQIFVEAFPIAKDYCLEHNIPLPPASSLLQADDIARDIMHIIRDGQQNDYYTHEGTREQALTVATDRAAFEEQAAPLYQAMVKVYHTHHPRA